MKVKLNSTAVCFLLLCSSPWACATGMDGGHLKYQFQYLEFPQDSLFSRYIDSPSLDNNADLRLNFSADRQQNSGRWDIEMQYQLLAKSGDSVELYNQMSALEVIAPFFPDDSRRLMNLTDYLREESDHILLHRLDRLSVTYTGDKNVFRLGRQAVSWGNGLMFNPMDLFNPFDPAAVDTEYKTGDDMLYGQHLQDSGNDMQGVIVFRRNSNGELGEEVSSAAIKYHGFVGSREIDLLLARHYDDFVTGLGGVTSLGGALLRTDLVITQTDTSRVFSGVLNLAYSWVLWNRNMSGSLEYFRNGFGISSGEYDPLNLLAHPELLKRLERAESYNLGRDYFAASVLIELHPLWQLTPNLFANLNDSSTLLQLVSTHSLSDNWQLLASLNAPFGEEGTEYGGIDSGEPGVYLSSGLSFFAQLAWYF